jgi:Arc/MetJ-type ribon-helix-helix transcriptional regulator
MRRTGKISITVSRQQLLRVKRIVEAGEFESAAAVVREALRAWLQRRTLHAGRLGESRLRRSLEARREPAQSEPRERVDLLFDAGDAKA